jgi:solute:Na+ symporter, SSS family
MPATARCGGVAGAKREPWMSWIDWAIAGASVAFVFACALYTKRYNRSVADFMAGGRAAGRYLICNAKGEASSGVANTIAKFQTYVTAGFVLSWWDSIGLPALMIASLFGFVVYRYRQTRAMTVGQFFEMRYSRNYRLFAGMLGFLAGILNYGVFPAVASVFFVYFLGLPTVTHIGPIHIQTHVIVMAVYLSSCLWMMLVGGQITLLVINCIDGILSHLVYVLMILAILAVVGWSEIKHLMFQQPHGLSMVNPFDAYHVKNFNVWYALIYWTMYIYQTNSVQKDNGYNSAARTPHEATMGGVLGNWRMMARNVMLVVVALGALTYLKRPDFPGNQTMQQIKMDMGPGQSQQFDQVRVPIALRYLLPVGIKGLFLTIMVLGMTDGDSAHILTWGGIFIQDVVLPIRGKPLTPQQHVRVLRWSVAGVAAFAFVFSMCFTQMQYISNWWAITEAIFVGGAGVSIIGGLYWSRGTGAAAWAAIITGAMIASFGIVYPYFNPNFKLNGTYMKAIAAGASIVVYVTVSLLTCREKHDMDKLLNRGKYAIADDKMAKVATVGKQRLTLSRIIGVNENFTFWDKMVSGGLFFWSMISMAIVLVGTGWNLIGAYHLIPGVHKWSDETWASYWFVMGLVIPMIIAMVTLVWFGIGGAIDLKKFFHRLATMKRDVTDDGTVNEHGGDSPQRGFEVALVPTAATEDDPPEPIPPTQPLR